MIGNSFWRTGRRRWFSRARVCSCERDIAGQRPDRLPSVEWIRKVIVFDAADLATESAFWAGIFEGNVVAEGDWHSVVDARGEWLIGVQLSPDHQPPQWPDGTPQQVHLDLHVQRADFESAQEQVTALGAQLLRQAVDPDAEEGFQVYADPAGHPFCIGWGHPTRERLAALVTDRFGAPTPVR
jgi:predicted enzyme related to lactoylglutathione lyase